jgi:hypothetical protein
LNCRVTGNADERAKQVKLHVAADKNIEVIAWWPKVWGGAKVVAAGKETSGVPINFGSEDFIRFALPKGDADVVVSPR